MANPISTKYRPLFIEYMSKVNVTTTVHGLPLMEEDKHWKLLDQAEEFLLWKKLRGNPYDAMQFYLRSINDRPQPQADLHPDRQAPS